MQARNDEIITTFLINQFYIMVILSKNVGATYDKNAMPFM